MWHRNKPRRIKQQWGSEENNIHKQPPLDIGYLNETLNQHNAKCTLNTPQETTTQKEGPGRKTRKTEENNKNTKNTPSKKTTKKIEKQTKNINTNKQQRKHAELTAKTKKTPQKTKDQSIHAKTKLQEEGTIIYADDANLLHPSETIQQTINRLNNYSNVATARQLHIQWEKYNS